MQEHIQELTGYQPPFELNYAPEEKCLIFSIPIERATELVHEWAAVCRDVVLNFEDYKVYGTGENEGRFRLDDGRVLQLFMTKITNVNEWAYCLYSANNLFEVIMDFSSMKNNPLSDFVSVLMGR